MTTLNQELDTLFQQVAGAVGPETVAVLAQGIERAAQDTQSALKEGDAAPDFTLSDVHGASVSLKALLKAGPVVVSFFRGSWCPFCNLELAALNRAVPEIKALGAAVLAVSPQVPETVRAFAEKAGLQCTLLHDHNNLVASRFGLTFGLPDAVQTAYKGFGVQLPQENGVDAWELPVPATYVIAPNGAIVLAHTDPNFAKRLEPSRIVEALKKL